MITKLFLGFTLVGAQWVLWFLIFLSILSVALILERWSYFRSAGQKLSSSISKQVGDALQKSSSEKSIRSAEFCFEGLVAQTRLQAESRLSWLATIGSNAPFVGLFGTVLGIIKAFHDLSQQGTQGSTVISAGISEALVATAVGLFVAIPAVVAYNFFQRRLKDMLLRAEKEKNELFAKQ